MPAITALCVMMAVVVPTSRFTSTQRAEHEPARFRVERARRFVAQEHVRSFRDRAGDGHALLFAAGELRRKVIETIAEADERECLFGAHRVGRDVGHERNVLPSGEARDEIVELEDEPDVLAAVLREGAIVRGDEVVIAKPDHAARGRVEAAENVQQRRFAAARRTENDDELALEEVEVHALEGEHVYFSHVVCLLEASRVEHGPSRLDETATLVVQRRNQGCGHASTSVSAPAMSVGGI